MKRTALAAALVISSLALAAAPPARPTAAQKKKYAESQALLARAKRERSRGQLREAMALFRRALAIDLELFGAAHDLPAEDLENMAATHAALGEFGESAECWAKVRAIAKSLRESYESWEHLADEFEKGMHAWQDGRGVTDPNERGRVERNLPTLRAYIWPRIAWNARL